MSTNEKHLACAIFAAIVVFLFLGISIGYAIGKPGPQPELKLHCGNQTFVFHELIPQPELNHIIYAVCGIAPSTRSTGVVE